MIDSAGLANISQRQEGGKNEKEEIYEPDSGAYSFIGP